MFIAKAFWQNFSLQQTPEHQVRNNGNRRGEEIERQIKEKKKNEL